MINSTITRYFIGALAFVAVLGLLRYQPWNRFRGNHADGAARQQLKVGFLPVT